MMLQPGRFHPPDQRVSARWKGGGHRDRYLVHAARQCQRGGEDGIAVEEQRQGCGSDVPGVER